MTAHILIVDDSEHLQTVLKLTLEFKGHGVTVAGDGRAALEAARAEKFDLIFCDIEMPVMNGIEFVRQFRAELGSATPIVMLTAEGDELARRALAAGATGLIHKPFEPIALLKEIDKYLAAQ
jgi:two-component system chemotaxis response regulator CheY